MNIVRIVLQLVLIALSVFGISALVEFYKKNIRKDHAKVWEIRLVSGALSVIAAVGFKVTGLFTPIITAIFTELTPWIDVALYAVVIFFLQLEADMKTLKAIVRFSTSTVLTEKEAVVAELQKFMLDFNTKTKLNVSLIVNVLKALGLTEETVEGYLTEIGVDEIRRAVLVEAFKEANK